MSRFKIVSSTCNTHHKENVTAFCKQHFKPLCMICILNDHAKCVAAKFVEDIRTTMDESERGIPNMISTSEHLTVVLNDWKSNNDDSLVNLDHSEETMYVGIEKLKLELIERIEQLADDSQVMVKSVVREQRRVLEHEKDIIDGFIEDLTETNTFVEALNNGQSFPIGQVKTMMEKFYNVKSKFNDADHSDKNIKLSFKVSEEVDYVRKKLVSFGELCLHDSKESSPHASVAKSGHQVDSGTVDDFGEEQFVSGQYNDLLHEGYVGIEHETPPPLPGSHPPAGSFQGRQHEKPENARIESMPNPSLFETTEKQRRPQTMGPLLDETDSHKLSIPPLPKKRHSQMKQNHLSTTSASSNEKTESTTQLNRATGSITSEVSTVSSITERVERIDGGTNSSSVSNVTLDDNVFSEDTQNKSVDEFDSSQSDVRNVRWQTGSFSSTDSSQQSENLDYLKLKPPKSHHFMWSSSGNTKIPTVRDSGIQVSNPDILATSSPSIKPTKRAFSDSTGIANPSYDFPKNLDTIHDTDEPLKSLSHSDLPNLQELNTKNKIVRTASDKSINWDQYTDEYEEIDLRKETPQSTEDSHNTDDSGFGTLKSVKSSSMKQCTVQQNKDLSSSSGTSIDSGSVAALGKPFVVKEKKSEISRNFKLPDVKDSSKHSGRSHHCTLTGIAITAAGHLLVCDFENHSVQHFNSSGVLVSDCTIPEPFSCCSIRDELVAVTSKRRQMVSIFELSQTSMVLRKEHKVGLATEIYGVGYADRFFAVCCRDQVTLLTEDLQPYCEVKPLMITNKKRSKSYFSDVRYVAIETTRIKTLLYTSEHNTNRITCISVDGTFKYHKEWECRVSKPRSVVIADDCLLVAAKGKIVVLGTNSGERMREIQNDVPSHPVHMVLHNDWLYISKTSTSNTESRILRKIRLQK